MHYLVTGGAGFIGTNIVKKLLADGNQVRVIDNYIAGNPFDSAPLGMSSGRMQGKEERAHDGAEYIEGDIRNMDEVKKVMKGIDGVFHEAAVPRVPYSVEHPQETNDHNLNGTLNILQAAKEAGVKRVVFATSSSVYGSDADVALKEDMPKRPKSPYALQKLAGQEYCRLFSELYGLETVSLCYYNIYGPYMDPDGAYALVIGKFLLQRQKGEPMTICGDGEYYRDYTHVDDCVGANLLAMESEKVGKGEMINIGNNKPYSVNQLAEIIGGETVQIDPRLGDPRHARADNTKAKELLGWEPSISLEDGIAELKKDWGVK
jgi:nucleoside-diphosphate-sugar epimerase